MSITISDKDGIQIVSNTNVNINATGNMTMSSAFIHISADQIELKGKNNTISLGENLIKLDGAEIKMN
ncbi:hypothetical protein D3C80_1954450 [compost metagenome]